MTHAGVPAPAPQPRGCPPLGCHLSYCVNRPYCMACQLALCLSSILFPNHALRPPLCFLLHMLRCTPLLLGRCNILRLATAVKLSWDPAAAMALAWLHDLLCKRSTGPTALAVFAGAACSLPLERNSSLLIQPVLAPCQVQCSGPGVTMCTCASSAWLAAAAVTLRRRCQDSRTADRWNPSHSCSCCPRIGHKQSPLKQ